MNLDKDSENPIDRGRLFIILTPIYDWEKYRYWKENTATTTEKSFLHVVYTKSTPPKPLIEESEEEIHIPRHIGRGCID